MVLVLCYRDKSSGDSQLVLTKILRQREKKSLERESLSIFTLYALNISVVSESVYAGFACMCVLPRHVLASLHKGL
jgi:hypothetical protein